VVRTHCTTSLNQLVRNRPEEYDRHRFRRFFFGPCMCFTDFLFVFVKYLIGLNHEFGRVFRRDEFIL